MTLHPPPGPYLRMMAPMIVLAPRPRATAEITVPAMTAPVPRPRAMAAIMAPTTALVLHAMAAIMALVVAEAILAPLAKVVAQVLAVVDGVVRSVPLLWVLLRCAPTKRPRNDSSACCSPIWRYYRP